MHNMDPPTLSIMQNVAIINKTMNGVQKTRVENRVADAFHTRNIPLIYLVHDLAFNSHILV